MLQESQMDNKETTARKQLTTEEASKIAGLSRSQITNLLRQKKLEGQNFGERYWIVYADSLEKYLSSPRKTGPKGPRKDNHRKKRNTTRNKKAEPMSKEASTLNR